MKKKIVGVAAVAALFLSLVTPATAQAARGDQGVDWAKYQGATGKFGYAHDKFAIAQVGGYYNGYFADQQTYQTQVQYAIADRRAHV